MSYLGGFVCNEPPQKTWELLCSGIMRFSFPSDESYYARVRNNGIDSANWQNYYIGASFEF